MTTAPTEWVLTPENLYRLWTAIGHSKVHNRVNDTGHVVPDGLTIWAHRGQPREVARFGDTIIRLPDGTYVIEPAEVTEFDDRDFCSACSGTVHTCVCSDQVTPHPSQL